MRHNYDKSFELVIGHEGGLSMDRQDRGNWTSGRIGRGKLKGTKYGVSAMSYPHLDIKNLTLDDAKAIYKKDYWDKIRGDELPSGLDYILFDIAINHGTGDAGRFVQRAVGATPDGAIGPKTLAAIARRDARKTIIEVNVERALDYAKIRTFPRFGRGWSRRNIETTLTALEMNQAEGVLDQSNGKSQIRALGGLFRKV